MKPKVPQGTRKNFKEESTHALHISHNEGDIIFSRLLSLSLFLSLSTHPFPFDRRNALAVKAFLIALRAKGRASVGSMPIKGGG